MNAPAPAPAKLSRRNRHERDKLFAFLFDQQDGRCFYCNGHLSKRRKLHNTVNRNAPTFDHFTPKAKGGSDSIYNLVLAHDKCNHLKGDRMPTPSEALRFVAMHVTRNVPIPARIVTIAFKAFQRTDLDTDPETDSP